MKGEIVPIFLFCKFEPKSVVLQLLRFFLMESRSLSSFSIVNCDVTYVLFCNGEVKAKQSKQLSSKSFISCCLVTAWSCKHSLHSLQKPY